MRSPTDTTVRSDLSVIDLPYTVRSVVTLNSHYSNSTSTSTSLSTVTPRIYRLLPHESASLTNAKTVPNTTGDTKLITCTGDVKQFSDIKENVIQPPSKHSPQLDSMLLSRLPRELRDKIYREAVLEDKEIPISVARYETKDGERRGCLQIEHALMHVCKQTRQEVADIYYLENVFFVNDGSFEERAIEKLSRLLAPWVERVKKVKISHTIVRSESNATEINFFVSASQGRIYIEPMASSLLLYRMDVNQKRGTVTRTTHSSTLPGTKCFCKARRLACGHESGGVFSWVQAYVDLVMQSQAVTGPKEPYCWNCAGYIVV
jgi:hypothetical protein